MGEPVYRCRDNKAGLFNAFESLRARRSERERERESQSNTNDTVRGWLDHLTPQSSPSSTDHLLQPTTPSSSTLLPPSRSWRLRSPNPELSIRRDYSSVLRSTHGNRLPPPPPPPPPPPSPSTRKRFTPDEFDRGGGQSIKRKKSTQPFTMPPNKGVVDDTMTPSGRGHRKKSPSKRFLHNEMEAKTQDEVISGSDSDPDLRKHTGERLALKDYEFEEEAATRKLLSSRSRRLPRKSPSSSPSRSKTTKTPQSTPSSPTKSNLSKGLPPVSKREQMALLTPAIRFWTLKTAKVANILSGKQLQLWLDYIRSDAQKIIPNEFKVRRIPLSIDWNQYSSCPGCVGSTHQSLGYSNKVNTAYRPILVRCSTKQIRKGGLCLDLADCLGRSPKRGQISSQRLHRSTLDPMRSQPSTTPCTPTQAISNETGDQARDPRHVGLPSPIRRHSSNSFNLGLRSRSNQLPCALPAPNTTSVTSTNASIWLLASTFPPNPVTFSNAVSMLTLHPQASTKQHPLSTLFPCASTWRSNGPTRTRTLWSSLEHFPQPSSPSVSARAMRWICPYWL